MACLSSSSSSSSVTSRKQVGRKLLHKTEKMSYPVETFASSQIDLHKLLAVSDSWVIGTTDRRWSQELDSGAQRRQDSSSELHRG